MARFEDSIDYVLAHEVRGYKTVNEDGFSDHPSDPGGPTFWGISLRFLKAAGIDVDGDGDIDACDVTSLTPDKVKEIYLDEFWDKMELSLIDWQPLATKIFDLAVNMGASRPTRFTQKALNNLGASLKVDGAMGPKTRAAINEADQPPIIIGIREEAAKYYKALAKKRPKMKVFLKGWLRRAAA